MMSKYPLVWLTSVVAFLATTTQCVVNAGCKCGPTDSCWPDSSAWSTLNASVSGKLIQNTPPAIVCYPGPQQDATACSALTTKLTNATFVGTNPVALDFPIDNGCPVPLDGQPLESCSIGDAPVYTVNATNAQDVAQAINFARDHNIRLVVRNTGHDFLGRSTGYGSLEIWIRYLRQGITFQDQYSPSDGCQPSWNGSAIKISGSYVWADVYAVAEKENVIIVGGGDPSVGSIGGWPQGGGHSDASRDYGLGADQILEAEVVLANGSIVTANSCQNSDLYTAIRGGGGGTYGVILSTTVKVYPQTNVVGQIFSMAPTSDAHIPEFMDALATIYSAYPGLNDAGYSGYGSWAVQSSAPIVGNSTTGYNHVFAMFGKSTTDAQNAYAPFGSELEKMNGTSIIVNVSYQAFPTYWAYYSTFSGIQRPAGTVIAFASHFFDGPSLTTSKSDLLQMLNTTAGTTGEYTTSEVLLISGGQVHADANETYSGVNADWRTAYLHSYVARGWAPGSNASTINDIEDDITYTKVDAMRKLAPNLGCYMNEADYRDPQYLDDFYGASLPKLEQFKSTYDPLSVFYCPTCVGSDKWAEDDTGRLCPT